MSKAQSAVPGVSQGRWYKFHWAIFTREKESISAQILNFINNRGRVAIIHGFHGFMVSWSDFLTDHKRMALSQKWDKQDFKNKYLENCLIQ